MALRFSQGVVNGLAMGLGWGDVIKNSTVVVYSGSQPTTADLAATAGTELVRFTLSSGALTAETRAAAKIAFSGSDGNVTALTIGSVSIISGTVTAVGTIAETVAALAANINANWSYPDYYAVVGGTTIGSVTYAGSSTDLWIIAPKNSGASLNGLTVSITTTITTAINGGSSTTMGGTGGVVGVAATNGLTMTYPAVAGSISKSGTWSGTASATGTAGWFRILCTPNYDTGLTNLSTTNDDSKLIMRIDGTVGTSGSDMLVTSTSITSAVSQTISSFALTVPSV